jgi:transcriptional regulator with XRE-family HTH domain
MSTCRNPKWKLQTGCSTVRRIMPSRVGLPEYDKVRVGERIALVRLAKNDMQQKLLAEAIEITPQKLSNYESGRDLIPVPTAVRLCIVTGIDFEYLYRGNMGNLPDDLRKRLIEAGNRPTKRRA